MLFLSRIRVLTHIGATRLRFCNAGRDFVVHDPAKMDDKDNKVEAVEIVRQLNEALSDVHNLRLRSDSDSLATIQTGSKDHGRTRRHREKRSVWAGIIGPSGC
jgi:hypothetical protein